MFASVFSFIDSPKRPFAHCSLILRLIAVLALITCMMGCDLKLPSFNSSDDESNRLSPRVVEPGMPVPKGGGRYKVGSPYRIKGKLYVPKEVTHYDQTGVASWYGELFHGRRTANGEVYDMEALTAAHPTLPLPSYVRVTNLRNGRALILRVNDRGPFARNREIDLSWAAAALLNMQKAGTAPVRVQYLGKAPISGSDRYERDFLARQHWAGPRIANARSPAVAFYRTRHLRRTASTVNRAPKHQTLSLASTGEDRLPETFGSMKPIPPVPVRRAALQSDRDRSVKRRAPYAFTAAPSDKVGRPPMARQLFYVNAGWFDQKPTAQKLATILEALAPVSIETSKNAARTIHLVRLGPFKQGADAYSAVERIRAAGLREAQIVTINES